MQLLTDRLEFQWDKGNKDKNLAKHNVTNQESEEVFINQPIVVLPDTKHSKTEVRQLIWGKTNKNRLLSIVFTLRKNKIRIISSRDMNKKERRRYEKITQTHSQV